MNITSLHGFRKCYLYRIQSSIQTWTVHPHKATKNSGNCPYKLLILHSTKLASTSLLSHN
uniref:Uncharacterized protein n=1 Tax=Arundo donax TaxID=35708 RepID=A0A0A9CCF8_ARUDO